MAETLLVQDSGILQDLSMTMTRAFVAQRTAHSGGTEMRMEKFQLRNRHSLAASHLPITAKEAA